MNEKYSQSIQQHKGNTCLAGVSGGSLNSFETRNANVILSLTLIFTKLKYLSIVFTILRNVIISINKRVYTV